MSGYVAILWHHHQPLYRLAGERHHLRQPWVRLHALRDYYSMAGLVAEHPEVRLTFNLTPVLLTQLDDYVDHGATDSQLERTLASPDSLTSAERQTLLATFFEADWHHQIFVHPRWGYQVQEPDVLHRPYGVDGIDGDLAMFFRDTSLSDAIGFRYQHETAENAAADFLEEIRTRFAGRDGDAEDNLVTVVLDGENAWGGYVEDGRPFLRSLYDRLGEARDIQTVTFSEYLNGESSRSVPSHPPERHVYELHTGSWIDEPGSEPGVDLGTWIGEPEENRAWEMLGRARRAVEVSSPGEARRSALEAVFAAEGSDWFWWLGEDQDSGDDDFFDELFRAHLRATYELLEEKPPDELDAALVRHHVVWSFTRPVDEVRPDSHFVVRTNCPGTLRWWSDVTEATEVSLHPVGGVLAGSRRFQAAVGRIRDSWSRLHFQFLCAEPDCPRRDECCRGAVQTVEIAAERFID